MLCLGCGEKLTRVTGKVTLDGKEVEGATVTFTSAENASIFASAMTNAEGVYSLQTLHGGAKMLQGIPKGSYIVAIVKKETDGPPRQDTSTMTIEERTNYEMSLTSTGGPMRMNFIYHIPRKYEVASYSGLTAEVPASGTVVHNFELDSR